MVEATPCTVRRWDGVNTFSSYDRLGFQGGLRKRNETREIRVTEGCGNRLTIRASIRLFWMGLNARILVVMHSAMFVANAATPTDQGEFRFLVGDADET